MRVNFANMGVNLIIKIDLDFILLLVINNG